MSVNPGSPKPKPMPATSNEAKPAPKVTTEALVGQDVDLTAAKPAMPTVMLPPLVLKPAGCKVPLTKPATGEKILVILESPSKAKTVTGYLASETDPRYKGIKVMASAGHIRDLPLKPEGAWHQRYGIDTKTGDVQFVINPDKMDLVKRLVEAAKKHDKILLMTDPDREGEAISWHLATVLEENGIPPEKIGRVTANEITRDGVKKCLDNPRIIDMDMTAAAIYRRCADRFEGYGESPWLTKELDGWRRENTSAQEAPAGTKIPSLSAGRVQNATLYLLATRHREREAFVPRSYGAVNVTAQADGKSFRALLVKAKGLQVVTPDKEGKPGTVLLTSDVMGKLPLPKAGDKLTVLSKETKVVKVPPKEPFTTTTLQIAASNALGLSAEATMKVAQTLFQKGLITYMRSDSPNVSETAQKMARDHIAATFGDEFVPKAARQYKAKDANAQEAHECVRPTHLEPEHADEQARLLDEAVVAEGPIAAKLLDLITRRFLASQMPDKIHDSTVANLGFGTGDEALVFKVDGNVTTHEGWTKLYAENEGEEDAGKDPKSRVLPPMVKGGTVEVQKTETTIKKTTPNPTYTEAKLVEAMGDEGVGRPATTPATLKTLETRGYTKVADEGARKRVVTLTPLGLKAFETLEAKLPEEVKPHHTADLEKQLHLIAGGKLKPEVFLSQVYSELKGHFPRYF